MRRIRSLLPIQILVLASLIVLPITGGARAQVDTAPDKVYELTEVTPPRPVYHPDSQYTESARKKKINGTVVVLMTVTPEGKVRDVKVIKSLEKSLDQQAMATVSTWKFEPATKDGKPVAVHVPAEVTFRLY
jgi:TonB family protein